MAAWMLALLRQQQRRQHLAAVGQAGQASQVSWIAATNTCLMPQMRM